MALVPLWRVLYTLRHDDGERTELRKAFVAAANERGVHAKLSAQLTIPGKHSLLIQHIYTHLEGIYT